MTVPANVYECMFILDTNKLAGDTTIVSKQLHTILEKHNAEVLASRPWMNQDLKLHYPIKNAKKGLYFLAYFRTEGKNLAGIEGRFRAQRDDPAEYHPQNRSQDGRYRC